MQVLEAMISCIPHTILVAKISIRKDFNDNLTQSLKSQRLHFFYLAAQRATFGLLRVVEFEPRTFSFQTQRFKRPYNSPLLHGKYETNCRLVPFSHFKKRGRHPRRTFTFKLQPETLLKVTLFHACFSRFLNFTNGNKSRKASLNWPQTTLQPTIPK